MDRLVLETIGGGPCGEGNGITMAPTDMFQEILERKEAELVRVLQTWDGIAIEKSADAMDEIQYASERDLAIRNVDRESTLLRQVKAALRRIHDGSFGTCIGMRIGDQLKTPRGRAMGVTLYPVPGVCRSRWAGKNGINRRDSSQCRVSGSFAGSSIAVR